MTASLSDLLLQDLCSERADAMVIELCPDMAVRVAKSSGVVVHFVLDGTIHIDVDGVDAPVALERGECALVVYGAMHRISTVPDARRCGSYPIGEWPVGDEPPAIRVGAGDPVATFVSAALRSIHDPARQIGLHPFPELIPLKRDAQPPFTNAPLFDDTSGIKAACRGPGAGAFVNALLNLFQVHALRCSFNQLKSSDPIERIWFAKTRPIEAALRMLRTHPEKDWTVASLAHELGQSRSSFATKFREHVGVGPMEYLGNIRMEKAAELLTTMPSLSVHAIARRVGYDTANSFTRAFKTRFGQSPRAFSGSDRLAAK